jgi:hypothetical protein
MAAYSTGCSALGWIVPKHRNLDGAGIGSGQSSGRARHCGDHCIGRSERPEVDDTRADAEFDAGHTAPCATLRSHCSGGKVQQLGVVGDEDQLGFAAGELNGTDHPVARLEADHVP